MAGDTSVGSAACDSSALGLLCPLGPPPQPVLASDTLRTQGHHHHPGMAANQPAPLVLGSPISGPHVEHGCPRHQGVTGNCIGSWLCSAFGSLAWTTPRHSTRLQHPGPWTQCVTPLVGLRTQPGLREPQPTLASTPVGCVLLEAASGLWLLGPRAPSTPPPRWLAAKGSRNVAPWVQ